MVTEGVNVCKSAFLVLLSGSVEMLLSRPRMYSSSLQLYLLEVAA